MRERLIGAWSLVDWTIAFSSGRTERRPFGDAPQGSLVYSDNGRMLAAISRAQRSLLSSPLPQQAPDVEKTAAFDSFFSYGGSYRLEGDEVVHMVDIALNPNFVGSEQRRRVQFDGEFLTLSAQEGTRLHALQWRRV